MAKATGTRFHSLIYQRLFPFLKKLLAVLEAEISLVEGVGILIGKVVVMSYSDQF